MSSKEKIVLLRELREKGIISEIECDNEIDNVIEKMSSLEEEIDSEYNIEQVGIYEKEIKGKQDNYNSEYIVNKIKNHNNINEKSNKGMETTSNIKLINIGFYLGITSIFIGREIGIIPLLAIVLILIGCIQTKEYNVSIKRRATIGFILGIIYFFMNLSYYNHF